MSASNSERTIMVSNRSTCDTMRRVLSLWEAVSWKYWLTRFFSFLALPT